MIVTDKSEVEFQPVTVEITLETEGELLDMIYRLDSESSEQVDDEDAKSIDRLRETFKKILLEREL